MSTQKATLPPTQSAASTRASSNRRSCDPTICAGNWKADCDFWDVFTQRTWCRRTRTVNWNGTKSKMQCKIRFSLRAKKQIKRNAQRWDQKICIFFKGVHQSVTFQTSKTHSSQRIVGRVLKNMVKNGRAHSHHSLAEEEKKWAKTICRFVGIFFESASMETKFFTLILSQPFAAS